MFRADRLDHVAIEVRSLERSISWYRTVLGMEERERYQDTTGRGQPTVLCTGNACLALFPADPSAEITPLAGHIAFRLDRENFEKARAHLTEQGVGYELVEYTTVHSLYFSDPDGYQIELSTWELQ